ncbi:MAG: class I SAM-dependent methyltransferase [Proteobacteria bacterium]|nr:class I SAM-dependent methyltransferase [Pseudomonadota bacterium]MBU1716412.1 class I SAM-dependent methyltransferase [Pseudomonadota bacterium]
MTKGNPYKDRYPLLKSRRHVWHEIVRFIAKNVGDIQTLVELGPGYCDFINLFPAFNKIAYEINPEMKLYAADDVRVYCDDAMAVSRLEIESVDMVFASNFFEHLDMNELDDLMPEIRKVLRPRGLLVFIQPNYRFCEKNYFDDPTHKTIFSDLMLPEFLGKYGFAIRTLVPALLPFSMKSRLPKWQFLVRLYLNSPIKPMAAQMYVVAVKE